MQWVRNWLGLGLAVILCWMSLGTAAHAATLAPVAELFEVNCAGCHIHGGNIVRRGKTLQLKALEKNGYSTAEAIADLIAHGKGNMSAYQERLSTAEIQSLATYVLEQAQQGWKS